ncbi:MAG TPA: FAD-dependent oxidoreductase [Erysipelothrix sp.]|nr:FAD-dependent oxidoreductase [Erysipelothrix sp.]
MDLNIFSGSAEVSLDPSITWDSVIIGGGPAGYNAAIYLARKGLKPLLLVGNRGGQIALSNEVENYLGFEKIDGVDLVERFHQHATGLNVDILESTFVDKLEKNGNIFSMNLSTNELVKAKTVIMATGGEHRKLGIEGEDSLSAHGVSFCAICDAPFFKDKEVVIVGGGDSAIEAAVDVAKWATHVHVVHRSVWRADQILLDRMFETENITYELGSVLTKIGGEGKVEYVEIYHKEKDTTTKRDVQGVFIEIGQDPRIDLVKDMVNLNDDNEIVVDQFKMTNIDGLYAAGDVTNTPYKQIITAASDGAIAGLSASNYILKMEEE